MPLTSAEIRQGFLDFFRQKGHTLVPSAPVVPQDDPTLLFTNAGMNQFKDVFLGQGTRPYTRAADTQKCIRAGGKHNDLEDVGHDTYHHTFFEMLGNWSFGDYYKADAIRWAWELLTEVWGLPKDRLYATVHHSDDEAKSLWAEVTDINPEHIQIFGDKDNFWEMGDTGPCGPCSEIHIDLTDDGSGAALVNAGVPEVMEIWNLVFIQYNREKDRSLIELPAKHVDTGMGFERVTAVLQGKRSNYDTDVFTPILAAIEVLSGRAYAGDDQIAMRVIADHLRALSFAIADGALPSNEGRGYVLRRMLRRAARYGRTLGLTEPFLHRLVSTLVATMGEAFPELVTYADHVARIIRGEEEAFGRTLDRGLDLFEAIASRVTEAGQSEFPGDEAFKLYDTYGFPVDLTALMAAERGLRVDQSRFDELMDEQRNRARAAGRFSVEMNALAGNDFVALSEGEVSFIGYSDLVEPSATIRELRRGDDGTGQIVLDRTPFYAESGGQIGDTGTLTFADGTAVQVVNTSKANGRTVHTIESLPTELPAGPVRAEVDAERRLAIMRNHTATHLLHAALRQVLGDHVHQKGSYVGPDRLRFDFTQPEKVQPEQLAEVERLVVGQIRLDTALKTELMDIESARKTGAQALFGEKYGDEVRVVTVGPFSKELCGGTHLRATGQTGAFRIVSEGSVASGVRRIEAVTGEAAEAVAAEERAVLQSVRALFPAAAPLADLPTLVQKLADERKAIERDLTALRREQAAAGLDEWIASAVTVGDIRVITGRLDGADGDALRSTAETLRSKLGDAAAVAVLGAVTDGKVLLVATATDAAMKRVPAGKLVGAVAQRVGGNGGGRPQLATAGGKDTDALPAALDAVVDIVGQTLGVALGNAEGSR